jgi:sporulation protein YlmC with PRC-barrel domain
MNMKKITVSIVTMLTALALTAPVYAAGEYKGTSGAKTESGELKAGSGQQSQMSQSQSAEEILGMSVVSRDGENLGEIQDLKIDTRTGRINYVTVQKGGVMGIGGQEGIPVPLEAFQFTAENAKLTVDKTKLDNVPKQSGMSDQEFQRNLQSHYGISPAWQEGQSGSQMQMSPGESGQSGRQMQQQQRSQ